MCGYVGKCGTAGEPKRMRQELAAGFAPLKFTFAAAANLLLGCR